MNKETEKSLSAVLEALHGQHVIAYPTEAVFGLGCDPDSEQAVEALLALKKRPKDKGLILIADNYQQLLPYIDDSSLTEQQLAHVVSFWPGPVTWLCLQNPRHLIGLPAVSLRWRCVSQTILW